MSSSSMHSSRRSGAGGPGGSRRAGEALVSGRSHHSWLRWPNTTPMRRASSRRRAPGETAHPGLPGRRDEHTGEHLDRRGLAGPVRPEEPHRLTRARRRTHAFDGGDLRCAAAGCRRNPGAARRSRSIMIPFPGSAAPPVRQTSPAARRRGRDERRAVAQRLGQPERVGAPEQRERREVRDEGAGNDEAHDPPQPGAVDGDRVGGGEVGAVGDRVGHLAPVDQPERHAVGRDPDRAEQHRTRQRRDDGDHAPAAASSRSSRSAQRQHGQPHRDPPDPAQRTSADRSWGRVPSGRSSITSNSPVRM